MSELTNAAALTSVAVNAATSSLLIGYFYNSNTGREPMVMPRVEAFQCVVPHGPVLLCMRMRVLLALTPCPGPGPRWLQVQHPWRRWHSLHVLRVLPLGRNCVPLPWAL